MSQVGLRVWGARAAAGRQQVLCRFDQFIDEVVLGRGSLRCLEASCVMPLAITPVVPVTAAKCQGYIYIYVCTFLYIHCSAWMPLV